MSIKKEDDITSNLVTKITKNLKEDYVVLQLRTKKFDICRISKLIAKYNVKASISNQLITLNGEISDELLDELCGGITICSIQNFDSEVIPLIQSETNDSESDEVVLDSAEVKDVAVDDVVLEQTVVEKYDLLYPTVKRGEVYLCDFGEPYGSEEGYKRPAIVVQNDVGNLNSPTIIVLPCTTRHKNSTSVHHIFMFSNENMIDYDAARFTFRPNTIIAEQIRTVDKTRLRKFLGTMTTEFMDKIQEIIDISLGLQRQKAITKTVDKNVYRDAPVNIDAPKERRDLNMVQMQLLSLVDINALFKISHSRDSDNIKAEKIIKLFGFDMNRNGVQYLFNAILISPKKAYFNLETLCDTLSKSEPDVERDEIRRLIIARIKEHFAFRKCPAIDFIRLINSFLIKEEEEDHDEKDNL